MGTTNQSKLGDDIPILVVDDDAMLLRMTEIVLSDLGYRVDLAASAADADRKIEAVQGGYALVVLDQRLPDRDGITVMRDAKERYPELRFMLVTGYATEDVIEQMMDAGAEGVLHKPYDIDQFAAAVKAAIAKGAGA